MPSQISNTPSSSTTTPRRLIATRTANFIIGMQSSSATMPTKTIQPHALASRLGSVRRTFAIVILAASIRTRTATHHTAVLEFDNRREYDGTPATMRNLGQVVSRELLPRVRNPAQYVGLETNARCGDIGAADVTAVLGFPDAYSIGISHLGSQVLYHLLNGLPGVACDRTYCPAPDAEGVMRDGGIPLFAWETRAAVADFDILGFSLAYEMCATNVLTMLDLAGVPLRSAERTEEHPLVIAGDAMADSPEPLADFIDLFLVGDGEVALPPLVELVRNAKRSGASREDLLLEAARTLPGAYAPRFYRPERSEGRALAACLPVRQASQPAREDVPPIIEHAHIEKLSDSPAITAPLVPLADAVHDRVVIEIMRGCPNACRFCQAGRARLPVRCRGVDEIIDIARAAVAATGYREISLLSLSASDYPHLGELIDRLAGELTPQNVSISLPSLRVDSQLRLLPKLTSQVRKGGLTIAAEAALPRMRKAIGKDITDENMLAGVRAAYEAGFKSVKVYFMAGLPGETQADIDGIFELCKRLSDTRKEVDGHPGAISASVSWFVPKPHTPMQWAPMRDFGYLLDVRNRLRDLSRRSPVNFKFHRIERSILEAVICRGDRRIGSLIEAAWRNGARMDAWNEHFDYDKWASAFEQTGIDPAVHAHREIPLDERLPWSHIRCKHAEQRLREEYERMMDTLRSA